MILLKENREVLFTLMRIGEEKERGLEIRCIGSLRKDKKEGI